MRVSVAAVISADGKLTRHDEKNIYDWVSPEDHKNFRGLIAAHDAIIMGRGSYEAIQHSLKPEQNRLRVVLTTHPEKFSDRTIEGQLEFYKKTPEQLVTLLEDRGYQNILIVGGGQMILDFLKSKLVDMLYLTIEPRLFGMGKPVLADESVDIELQLIESKQLNSTGTLLLTYRV